MKIVITGGAGFIGAWTAKALHENGHDITIVDDFSTTIYESSLKEARAKELLAGMRVVKMDILENEKLAALIQEVKPSIIIHLAAIAGIRYAQKDPLLVERVNIGGTVSVFEAARKAGVNRIIYASSSSVYGVNKKTPFHENDPIENIVSDYAVTKRACEIYAEKYRRMTGVHATGIRFFTAYGPWGRPDMAYFSFTRSLFEGSTIALFADGKAGRDFTSVHDIVRGIGAVVDDNIKEHTMLNLGNAQPSTNGELLKLLESIIGKRARIEMKLLPQEDVPVTYADVSRAKEFYNWEPRVKLEEGLREFVKWYQSFYKVL